MRALPAGDWDGKVLQGLVDGKGEFVGYGADSGDGIPSHRDDSGGV